MLQLVNLVEGEMGVYGVVLRISYCVVKHPLDGDEDS